MQAFRWSGLALRAAFGVVVAAGLASCGSGAVSGTPAVNDPGKITILPAPATLYSGLPTTFTITGGTGSYIVASSDQSVLPISGVVSGGALTLIPNPVSADTAVTLSVRDTGSTPATSAALTVKPGTVGGILTIIPSATQGGSCAPAVCSGGDAVVTATLAVGGQALPFHAVRFEAVSGDFRFITSSSNSTTEVTDTTTTVLTDASGTAIARIRVFPIAPNQTAVIRVVDVDGGAFRNASFTIAQSTGASPGFFAAPSTLSFTGPNNQQCASNVSGTVSVFGGVAPYVVTSGTTAFSVSPGLVGASGGSFAVIPNGICSTGTTITIADAAGHTTTVTGSNTLGTATIPPLVVSPGTVTLTRCLSAASVTVAGGTGQYVLSSSSEAVLPLLSGGNTITIRRVPGSTPPPTATIGVASGNAVATITVNISGEALGSCDPNALTVTPNAVTLSSCNPVDVIISGGAPPYIAFTNNSAITATIAPLNNGVRIERTHGSATFSPPAVATVRDNRGALRDIPVDANGAGLGNCP